MSDFRKALARAQQHKKPLLFDGGMGTMLQSRGLPAGANPERFCLANPDTVIGIHADYAKAGADVLVSCTFGGTSFKLPPDIDPEHFNAQMARLAKRAAASITDRPVFVAGDIGPSGHFVPPLGEISCNELYQAFRLQARGLAKGGADLVLIETQFDLAEARIAVAAVREECDLPIAVSMTFEEGVSLTGTTPDIFASTMANLGVDLIGVNCGAGPEGMYAVVESLLAHSPVPVLVEPNAGLPELIGDETVFRLPPEAFAQASARFLEMGVVCLGGCCGTTPAHIAALASVARSVALGTPNFSHQGLISLTTRTQLVHIGGDSPLCLIGERINPTGKKDLQAELAAGEFTRALAFAAEQTQAGARVLDVNVGAPLVDESLVLPQLVSHLTARHQEPLSLDSSNPAAIAAALPLVPGSALVNSISGEEGRMETLGPLCRIWGAPFMLLPLKGSTLPVKAAERIAIIEELLEAAEGLGLPRRMALVDVLALAVGSQAEAAKEALETIRWCRKEGIATSIGLSNISFGLPARELVNATFLAMCAGAGLSACIANPGSQRVAEAAAATDVLMARENAADRFVASYSGWKAGSSSGPAAAGQTRNTDPVSLEEAILGGNHERIIALVDAELEKGADPFALVQERLIPAITEVGQRYARREYFLPQLLRSAETMQKAFAHIKPLLAVDAAHKRPVIVLATVEGDIHDIGKNIVALMLGNHGYEVVDLGKDVKAEAIVEAAVRHKAAIIGLSALMTTTMVRMQDTIDLVRERQLPIKVLVGGAVVTPAFAERIGADGFSLDAVDAVAVAARVLAEK